MAEIGSDSVETVDNTASTPSLQVHSPTNDISASPTTLDHVRPSLDANALVTTHRNNLLQQEEVENIRTRPSLQANSGGHVTSKRSGKLNFNKRVKETLKRIEQMPDTPPEALISSGTKLRSPSSASTSKEGFKHFVSETARKSFDVVRRAFLEDADMPPVVTTTTLSTTAVPRKSFEASEIPLTDTIVLPSGQTGIVDPATGQLLATLISGTDGIPPEEQAAVPEPPPPVEEEFPMEKARKAARNKRRLRRKQESLAKQILQKVLHHLKLFLLSVVVVFFVFLWLVFEPRNAERVFVVSQTHPLTVPLHEQASTYSLSFHVAYPKHPVMLNYPETSMMELQADSQKDFLKFDLEYSLEAWNLTRYGNLSEAFSSITWNPTNSTLLIPFEHHSKDFFHVTEYWIEEEEEKEWHWNLPQGLNSSTVHYRLKVSTSIDYGIPLTVKMVQHPIAYNYRVIFALCILVGVYVLIIFELVPRTLAAMIGSFVAVATLSAIAEKYTLEEIVLWIDYSTLALLFSMMVIVAVFSKTGVFEFISFVIFRISGGKIWLLTIMFSIFTAFVSAFLDNVTTMLLVAPVTIEICKTMNISPVYLLITEVMMSNVGGASTPVGDPPGLCYRCFVA